MGEPLTQAAHCFHGFIHAQRGLRKPNEVFCFGRIDPGCFFWVVNQGRVIWRVTHRALNLFMAFVANQEDVVILTGETNRFPVHFGHQRAGCINGVQFALGCLSNDHRRDTVRGEDDVGSGRDLG